jgi:Bax protein
VALGIPSHGYPRVKTEPGFQTPIDVEAPGSERFRVPRDEYQSLPDDLADRQVAQDARRTRFVTVVLPLILAENERLAQLRQTVEALLRRARSEVPLPEGNALWLRELAVDYGVGGDPVETTEAARELLRRIDQIPPSMALAQAALETGWGSSGAARRDHDLFGMVGVVSKAAKARAGKRRAAPHFVHLVDSVRSYMHNINTHAAYRDLRKLRARLREQASELSGRKLAVGLNRYSELGVGYVKKVQELIRSAALARYDHAVLDTGEPAAPPALAGLPGSSSDPVE